jgi:hypothetical protein
LLESRGDLFAILTFSQKTGHTESQDLFIFTPPSLVSAPSAATINAKRNRHARRTCGYIECNNLIVRVLFERVFTGKKRELEESVKFSESVKFDSGVWTNIFPEPAVIDLFLQIQIAGRNDPDIFKLKDGHFNVVPGRESTAFLAVSD